MLILEWTLLLLAAAVALSALARRWQAPYPALLAAMGAVIAFVPGAPHFVLEPQLALALFVAPILLDTAYDTSKRDLRENWVSITALVFFAVGVTTIGVAWIAKLLVPDLPWAAAITLGAIVAPPDAAAATAVLRATRPPHRIMQILEGESLFNDASALLIYRFAVGAAMGDRLSAGSAAPVLVGTLLGSLVVGAAFAWVTPKLVRRIEDVPTSIVVQFVATFGVWIVAERLALSGILAVVTFAIIISRISNEPLPARIRVPSFAVWATVVFVLNVLAFVLIGLQVGPILERLQPDERIAYAEVALAVLGAVVVSRFLWVMSYNAGMRWRAHLMSHSGLTVKRPTVRGGLIIGWCGMRGIVTLAAALALPEGFPYRNLILVTSFIVVLGTLLVQGLTLRPLLLKLDLHDDGPVERETAVAREAALQAVMSRLEGETSKAAKSLRFEFNELWPAAAAGDASLAPLRRDAVSAARTRLAELVQQDVISDDAYHRVESELDRAELYAEAASTRDVERHG